MWPPWRWRPSMRGSSGRSWLGMSPIGPAGPRRFEFDRTGEVSILDCSSEIELDGSRSDRRGMSLEKAPVHDTAKPMRPLRATVIRVSAPTAHAKTGYTAAVRSLLTKSLKSPLHSRGSPYTRFLPASNGVMSAEIASCDFGQSNQGFGGGAPWGEGTVGASVSGVGTAGEGGAGVVSQLLTAASSGRSSVPAATRSVSTLTM